MMSATDQRWFHRRGQLARDGWESVVDRSTPGWAHTGLRVAELADGVELALTELDVERIVVPLSGSFEVTHRDDEGSTTTTLAGRASVFDGPTDVLYLGAGTSGSLRGQGRVAIATSPTADRRPMRYIPASDTPVELRQPRYRERRIDRVLVRPVAVEVQWAWLLARLPEGAPPHERNGDPRAVLGECPYPPLPVGGRVVAAEHRLLLADAALVGRDHEVDHR